MWLILLEALLALTLLIVIVWATMGRASRRDRTPKPPEKSSARDEPPAGG